jgi:peptidyl-tRNA hydrolase, PTH1 family
MNSASIDDFSKRDKKAFLLFNRRMIIIMGLGNPGKKYSGHRHNIGFQILDTLAEKEGLYFNERSLSRARIAPFGEELLLVKPQTFMNDSGISAKMLLKQYDASLVVIYDDIDIELGTVKCSFGRGAGGHNGLQSIIDHIGHKDFARIRVGVRPVHEELLPRIAPPDGFEKFLLSDFAPMEEEKRKEAIQKTLDIITLLPEKNFEEIMNQYN